MTRLLQRASLRFYLRHPWQLALAVAGISLGVGVFVGITLANGSAARAFDLAADTVRGGFTHRLLPIDGALDEQLYRELSVQHGIARAAPLVAGRVAVAGLGRTVPLVGIEPLQGNGPMRAAAQVPPADNTFVRMLTDPATVLVPTTLAAELGVDDGGALTLGVGGTERRVSVLGLIPDGDIELTLVADIAAAQELLGRLGQLDRIDLTLTGDEAATLGAALPAGTVLLPVDSERSAFRQLTAAFRTNLTALGLLALVVGAFLIYGTMSFAIVQRATTLGILRALGVTQLEVVQTVLAEALAIGAIATALGLIIGQVLAVGLVALVLQTIDDLSFGAAVRATAPSVWIYVQGAVLGLGATAVAALKPALDAARGAPAAALRRSTLELDARTAARRGAWLALPLLGGALALLAFGPRELYVGFGALFAVLAAGALLTPLATLGFAAGIEGIFGTWLTVPGRLAVRGVGAALSRTGVATAALAVSVATVVGIGLMIATFRASLGEWLDTTLTADLYVASDEGGRLRELVESRELASIPGVAGVGLTRLRTLPTSTYGTLTLRAVQPGARGFGLTLVEGRSDALAELAAGRGVVVSERLLLARRVAVGDELTLPTPAGNTQFAVAAAFRDFNTSEPAIVVALNRYREVWDDDDVSNVGLDLEATADVAVVTAKVEDLLRGSRTRVRSTQGLKELSLQVFDRTFEVTEVLRVLAGVVAFLGVLSALLALELERTRELGVLRTLGVTPRGLSFTLLTQTGLLGAAAGLAAAPLGAILAALLVHVINRRSFGWSMEFTVAPGAIVSGFVLSVVAAVLAGVYPAWRASRIELGPALREE